MYPTHKKLLDGSDGHVYQPIHVREVVPARHATAIYLKPQPKPDLWLAWHGRKSSHHFSLAAAQRTAGAKGGVVAYAKIGNVDPQPDPRSIVMDAAQD